MTDFETIVQGWAKKQATSRQEPEPVDTSDRMHVLLNTLRHPQNGKNAQQADTRTQEEDLIFEVRQQETYIKELQEANQDMKLHYPGYVLLEEQTQEFCEKAKELLRKNIQLYTTKSDTGKKMQDLLDRMEPAQRSISDVLAETPEMPEKLAELVSKKEANAAYISRLEAENEAMKRGEAYCNAQNPSANVLAALELLKPIADKYPEQSRLRRETYQFMADVENEMLF